MSTKTTNPLHFEDLDPHRFEDLVRQLIYDFRNWLYLEALGRSGSDEGIDIRAIERNVAFVPSLDDEEEALDESIEETVSNEERRWFIQCKRHKEIGPAQIRQILQEGPEKHEPKPFGYILAAACDFSKASRDEFHSTLADIGIEEHHMWGRAELEDMLFLPKNDHLLFAYFGISHRVRRRSMKTLVRSRLATKRRLVKVLGGIRGEGSHTVLLRDPADESYPYIEEPDAFLEAPRWRYWELHTHTPPDHVSFVVARHHAYVNWETREWDMWEALDVAFRPHPRIFGIDSKVIDPTDQARILDAYVELEMPEENRAWAFKVRPVHYDRILVVDDIGDVYNEPPYLLVDFLDRQDPFEPREVWLIEERRRFLARSMRLEDGTRVEYFPEQIPDRRTEWLEALQDNLGA